MSCCTLNSTINITAMGVQRLPCGSYCPSAPSARHLQSKPMRSALLTTPCMQIRHLNLRDADLSGFTQPANVGWAIYPSLTIWCLHSFSDLGVFFNIGRLSVLRSELGKAVSPLLLGWHPSITTPTHPATPQLRQEGRGRADLSGCIPISPLSHSSLPTHLQFLEMP